MIEFIMNSLFPYRDVQWLEIIDEQGIRKINIRFGQGLLIAAVATLSTYVLSSGIIAFFVGWVLVLFGTRDHNYLHKASTMTLSRLDDLHAETLGLAQRLAKEQGYLLDGQVIMLRREQFLLKEKEIKAKWEID